MRQEFEFLGQKFYMELQIGPTHGCVFAVRKQNPKFVDLALEAWKSAATIALEAWAVDHGKIDPTGKNSRNFTVVEEILYEPIRDPVTRKYLTGQYDIQINMMGKFV